MSILDAGDSISRFRLGGELTDSSIPCSNRHPQEFSHHFHSKLILWAGSVFVIHHKCGKFTVLFVFIYQKRDDNVPLLHCCWQNPRILKLLTCRISFGSCHVTVVGLIESNNEVRVRHEPQAISPTGYNDLWLVGLGHDSLSEVLEVGWNHSFSFHRYSDTLSLNHGTTL